MFGTKILIAFTFLGFLSFRSPVVNAACSRTCVRKELRDLSAGELQTYLQGLHAVNWDSPRPNVYDRVCEIHWDNAGSIHSCSPFLPWHRRFVRRLERHIQQYVPDFCFHYWDWSQDYKDVPNSWVMQNVYGGNGNGGDNYCIDSGPFSGWTRYFNDDGSTSVQCVQREFTSFMSSIYSAAELAGILQTSDFADLTRQLDFPHSYVHLGCGRTMTTMHSCLDPIFFGHHGFIDKLYYDWQQQHPDHTFDYDGNDCQGNPVTPFSKLPFWDFDAWINTQSSYMCYSYQQPINALAGKRKLEKRDSDDKNDKHDSDDKNGKHDSDDNHGKHNKNNYELPEEFSNYTIPAVTEPLNYSQPLPDWWIKMQNMNCTEVREIEAKHKRWVDVVNNYNGYQTLLNCD